MPKLIILRGIPGSGKTTWASNYCKEHRDTVRINNDDIRRSCRHRFTKEYQSQFVIPIADYMCEKALSEGIDVIVDNVNINSDRICDLVKDIPDVEIFIKDFNKPLDECIKNDKVRHESKGVKLVGADKIAKQYEYYKCYIIDKGELRNDIE